MTATDPETGRTGTGTDRGGTRPPRWPWALLAAAALWAVAVRVPLVLNAPVHLDSDLAVDGLTLLEATEGRWRWHYPGTPHIGAGGVLLSWPQAMAWGANPATLVSGGTVAYLGLLLGAFALTYRAFGASAAAWSVVPLTFASNGAVWLSGRITGGHLLDAGWHAGAFALLVPCVRRGGALPAFGLGLWSGLGMYLDSMFAVTLAGLLPVALLGWFLPGGRGGSGIAAVAAFAVGFGLGLVPREVGKRAEPHNAYGPQFETVSRPELLIEHAALLGRDCLPRLIAGHRLPGLETDPDPSALTAPSAYRTPAEFSAVALGATALSLTLWGLAWLAVGREVLAGKDRAGRLVAAGLTLSALATLAGFVVNRNIFNSDNYRYLVGLLVPWSVGYGLLMAGAWRRGAKGKVFAGVFSVGLAALMTADLADWYARFGWVDGRRLPARAAGDDPLLNWLEDHPEVGWVEGGYWDVYRLAFLTGGRVRGAPFPVYPNRYPGWRPQPGARRALIARPTPEARPFLDGALRAGGKVAGRAGGATVLLIPENVP